MRLHKIGLSALALACTFAACDKKLDLEPAQNVSEELALSTDANVKSVLLGAYDALASDGLWGGNALRDGELQAADGELRWVGTFTGPREIYNHAMIATNGEAEDRWSDAYDVINRVNNVLDALDIVLPEDRAQVEGEARFIRAAAYFELVRFFAQPYDAAGNNTQLGVPLVLRPTRGIDASSQVARNSVEEVYTQILDDLTKAEGLLPAENGVLAGQFTAAALLARVNLQMGRYAEARSNADAVIGSGLYALISDYADEWNNDDNTSEDIYAVQVSSQDFGEATLTIYYSIPEFGGRDGDIEIEQKHLDLYEAGDARLAFFYEGAGAIRSGKWRNQYRNLPIIRLAEMYLIRAEANLRLGGAVGAPPVDDYNALRVRAGLAPAASVSLEELLLERRRELAHEGHRIHDVKRLKESVDGLAYNDPKLVFPIPAREIEANPKLQQNEGY